MITIDSDPITRKDTRAYDVGDELVLEHRQDVQDLVEINKEMRNQHDGRWKEDFNLALRIPQVVVEDLHRRKILGDPDAFKAWMRTEEADPWRVHPSRDL